MPIGGHAGDRMASRAPVEEIRVTQRLSGVRGRPRLDIRLLRPHQALRIGKWQRPQQHGIQQAEDGGGRTDAQCQGQNGRNRKAGTLAELADGKAHKSLYPHATCHCNPLKS